LKGLRFERFAVTALSPSHLVLIAERFAIDVGVRLKGKDVPGLKSLKFEGFAITALSPSHLVFIAE